MVKVHSGKDDGPGAVWPLGSFDHNPLHGPTIKNVKGFAIGKRLDLKLINGTQEYHYGISCQCKLYTSSNRKVSGGKDHGKSYIKARPLFLLYHLLHNCLSVIYLMHL